MGNVCFQLQALPELGLARVSDVVEEGDVLVAARLGVRDPRQAEEFEADSVAPLTPVGS